MIETEFQFIRFAKFAPDPKKKTDTWACIKRYPDTHLGVVKWYGPWRQYCFFVGASPHEFIFSVGCLRDISEFIKSLMAERKGYLAH